MPDQSQPDRRNPGDAELDVPLWGAVAIGLAINRSPRQTVYMLERGLIPASKVGKSWVTTPRRLRERLVGEVA
jgi:hypothetical protein